MMDAVVIFIVMVLSIFYRIKHDKPIFVKNLDLSNVTYQDNWVSGHSFNIFRALGGAQRCLWIRVTEEEVVIGPHFPFCLFFLPEVWGHDYRFNKKDLANVQNNIFGVVVSYNVSGSTSEFRVFPTRKMEFIAAIST